MQITPDLVRGAIEECGPGKARNPDLLRPDTKNAAVVVGIRLAPEPMVLAVLRSSSLREHGGEVGFPGGKQEPADADLWATAVRELEEEVGVAATDVDILGPLTPIPVITGRYLIHPYAARLRDGAVPRICSGEIARIIDIPMRPWLSGERPIHAVQGVWRGRDWVAPYFDLPGCVLYGASAVIFYELLAKVARRLGRELELTLAPGTVPWGNRYTEFSAAEKTT